MNAPKLKSNSTMGYAISEDRNVSTFTVVGETRPALTFDRRKASEVCRDYAEAHGWKQRIVDAAAMPMGTPAGERYDAMAQVIAHYEAGGDEWALPRTATGPGFDRILLAAVAEALGVANDEGLRERLKAQAASKNLGAVAYLNGLAKAKAVAPIVERMRAAQPVAFDPDEALEGL